MKGLKVVNFHQIWQSIWQIFFNIDFKVALFIKLNLKRHFKQATDKNLHFVERSDMFLETSLYLSNVNSI